MENYFSELIELMDILDIGDMVLQEDDILIPRSIINAFHGNREHYFYVSILRKFINNSIYREQMIQNEEFKLPEGDALRNKRRNMLREHYIQDYIPILNEVFGETTLKIDF